MKRILFLAASVAMAASSSAFAADAVETIPEAPIAVEMPAPFSWSGPYIGVHGGYGWGDGSSDFGSGSFDGGRFGGFAGYNWQVSNGFVAGIEGDLNYDWNDDDIGGSDFSGETGFNGGIRARAGFAFDRALIYAAGGWTATNISVEDNVTGLDDDDTLNGWTIGAGIDYAFTDTMFGRAEYRYNDYGSGDVFGQSVDFDQHVFQVGLGVKF
jgi:outer membrane immunogenic protein